MHADQLAAALIDASPDGLLLVDRDGVILLANPVAAAMFGRTALVGSAVEDLMPNEFVCILAFLTRHRINADVDF